MESDAELLARIERIRGPICPWCRTAPKLIGHAKTCPINQLTQEGTPDQ